MSKSLGPLSAGCLVGAVAAAAAFFLGTSSDSATPLPIEPSALSPDLAANPNSRPGESAATGLGVPANLLRLAENDANAALAGLGSIEPPKARRETALALVGILGGGESAIDRIAGALPPTERMSVVLDAIALHAVEDPRAAIGFALALEGSSAQTEAVTLIAHTLAVRDPRLAVASGAAIDNYALASAYNTAVFREWASIDPVAFLEFLESAPTSDLLPADSEVFRIAALSDPGQLLAALEDIPLALRTVAAQAALEALVKEDAPSAFAYIDSLPPGTARDRLVTSTAQSFAAHDTDGALAWLDSRPAPEAALITAILQVVIDADPIRGVDALIATLTRVGGLATGDTTDRGRLETILASFTPGAREDLRVVAERLSAVDNPDVRRVYEVFILEWSQNDAEAAHDWAFANVGRLTPGAVFYLARNLAAERPDLAKLAVSHVPADMRDLWTRTVAERLARDDFADALQWISAFQGSAYEVALDAALRGASPRGVADPESAAQFLARQPPPMRAEHLPAIASLWARQDPAAAARWVEAIVLDPAAEHRRDAALGNVASRWALQDADRARGWALGLPPGARRDEVLSSLLRVGADSGDVDRRLVDALSSNEAAANPGERNARPGA
jgi:hypothetical protein